ncbi:MAG: hypothetical protein ACM3WV_12210 [Bacillota bacterium]
MGRTKLGIRPSGVDVRLQPRGINAEVREIQILEEFDGPEQSLGILIQKVVGMEKDVKAAFLGAEANSGGLL